MGRTPSAVITQLRTARDELQFGRVLAGVLSGDDTCASKFVNALLREAARDPGIGRRAARTKPVGKRLSCTPEQGYTRVGRGTTAALAKDLGRIDLHFRARPDFRLACELKIDSPYQDDQILGYLQGRPPSHVISIVRKRGSKPLGPDVLSHKRWLGEVAWGAILGDLKGLPLHGKEQQQWLDLLAVVEADGDFSEKPPKRTSDTDREVAHEVAERTLRKLKQTLRGQSRRAASYARELSVGDVKRGRDSGWADIVDDLGPLFTVRIQRTGARRPRVEVRWLPWTTRRIQREQRTMHERLVDNHDFEKMGNQSQPYYRLVETPTVNPGEDLTRVAAGVAWRAVGAVVGVGLLRSEIKEFGAE